MRRQSQKCLDDIKELQEPDIQACLKLLMNATETKATQFCQDACASKLHDIYQKLHTDCGDLPHLTNASIKFIGELCEKNKFNRTCTFEIVDMAFYHTPDSFSCEYTQPGDCTSGCRLFLMYVQDNVGCCINVMVDGLNVTKPDQAKELADLWGLCDMGPPPPPCKP
jgi:hypothetical protein